VRHGAPDCARRATISSGCDFALAAQKKNAESVVIVHDNPDVALRPGKHRTRREFR